MATIDYISRVADDLTRKFDTRNPFEICDGLGIKIRLKDLGQDIKAYVLFLSQSHSKYRDK